MAKGKAKIGIVASLQRTLEQFYEAAESHNAAESAEISMSSQAIGQYSIPKCVQAMKSLQNEGRLSISSNEVKVSMQVVKRRKCARFYQNMYGGATIAILYHMKYLMKQGNRFNYSDGWNLVRETLQTPSESYRMFMMESHAVLQLIDTLINKERLHPSKDMTALEAVAMFLWTCAHSGTNRNVQNKFRKSRETVSRKFGEVLDNLSLLANEIVKASDFQFAKVPSKIKNDRRYWPYFQRCIGALDGSHAPAISLANDQIFFIGRKGYPTHNVMLMCNFHVLFTFVVVGWPGTAHDTRIFSTMLEEKKTVFPHPPEGKYYVADAGYPNMKGQPQGVEETFNHAHSSLRNEKIIVATTALHNYIRQCGVIDEEFDKCDRNPNYIPESQEERSNDEEMGSYSSRRALDDSYMGRVCNQIATALMKNRNR
ncbi:uncharacterized protein LOC110427621 [Herrania umbratica]|uniref:Uncharacterized protein LOC110427621 n=1 Tax=Herrania umbratica TaxID=108875 RepID=A0A6J1BKP7_9ROSI|nr:uncharacterized protein LOC110427621 [Herrania umbratica]